MERPETLEALQENPKGPGDLRTATLGTAQQTAFVRAHSYLSPVSVIAVLIRYAVGFLHIYLHKVTSVYHRTLLVVAVDLRVDRLRIVQRGRSRQSSTATRGLLKHSLPC